MTGIEIVAAAILATGIVSGAYNVQDAIHEHVKGNVIKEQVQETNIKIENIESEIKVIDGYISNILNCKNGYSPQITEISATCFKSSSQQTDFEFKSSSNESEPEADFRRYLFALAMAAATGQAAQQGIEYCKSDPKKCAEIIEILKNGAIELGKLASWCKAGPLCSSIAVSMTLYVVTSGIAMYERNYKLGQQTKLDASKIALEHGEAIVKSKSRLQGIVEGLLCQNPETYMFVSISSDRSTLPVKLCLSYDLSEDEDEETLIQVNKIMEGLISKLSKTTKLISSN